MVKLREGAVVHVELISKNPKSTQKFFSKVFGWKFVEVPGMEYATFRARSGPGGGVMKSMKGFPPGVSNYLYAKSIDKTLSRVVKAGGKVLRPKDVIPGIGWHAAFEAPGGVVFALFQAR